MSQPKQRHSKHILNIHEAFLAKLTKEGPVMREELGRCWIWLARLADNGYPRLRKLLAHRYSYEHYKGKIPDGAVIDHLCRMRCCVNPDHLEAVTQRENLHRGNGLVGLNYRKTHCMFGHSLSGSNLKIIHKQKGIQRQCRICISYSFRKQRGKV